MRPGLGASKARFFYLRRVFVKSAIIFDLDGTLLDTLDDLRDALNHALTTHSYPVRTLDETRRFVGNGIRNLVSRGVPAGTAEAEIDAVFATFKPYYQAHCLDKTKPYEGILELLGRLKEEHYPIAVVSNKADSAVQTLCQRFFPGLVDFAVGERENVRRKPAPDSVLAALDALGVTQTEAVYVGDSEVDIETARNGGLPCISVTWGFRAEDVLENAGADTFAHTPEELWELLHKAAV